MTGQDGKSGKRMAGLALMLGAGFALAGCQESGGGLGFLKAKPEGEAAAADGEAAPQTEQKMVERDIEAPQVFSTDEKGLWDGRPSLGGVWVAHPNVKDPERVIIRNPANGKFVIGALFKRETDNPGPKLQVSSDAAEALGMLAGAPTELSVVALRRETVPVEQPKPLVDKPVIAKPETVEQKSLDEVKATAAAGIAKAETKPKPPAKPTKTTTAPAKPAESVKTPTPAKPAIGAAPAPAPAPAPPVVATEPAAPKTPKAPAGKMYIQIGIFSVEENAKRAVEQMSKAGVIAQINKESSHDKTFWRVVAGPAPTKTDLKALEKTIHELGYPDAYPVTK
ncbi:SPOR domain-containing protein [Thioclava pacifica]|uniref:SPOR domain-containing protein n=1 Tax=Thioclava pacifica DSM 10166 TaxID=1353537 RepID=A0A074J1D8_9RHOB|nr:SPOR domain-containing protein [Thioclava pacifica]KEO51181.1 hypothetical protein TP2_12360 [Thioclava pacifica DSM 10166]